MVGPLVSRVRCARSVWLDSELVTGAADRWSDSFQLIVGQTGSAALVNTCWELNGRRRRLLDLCFVMSALHTLAGRARSTTADRWHVR